jgi:hypothetical protein
LYGCAAGAKVIRKLLQIQELAAHVPQGLRGFFLQHLQYSSGFGVDDGEQNQRRTAGYAVAALPTAVARQVTW